MDSAYFSTTVADYMGRIDIDKVISSSTCIYLHNLDLS